MQYNQSESQKLHHVEFWILNSLAEDYESMVQILPAVRENMPDMRVAALIDRLKVLLKKGHVRVADGRRFNKYLVLLDLWRNNNEYSSYWFGMTESGCDVSERYSEMLGLEVTDWHQSWKGYLNYQTSEGYVLASSYGSLRGEAS